MAQMWSLQARRGTDGRTGGLAAAQSGSGSSVGWWLVREGFGFFLICCETMCRWHSRPAGRNGGTRDAKAGFLILNRFPCQGTNVPRFKIIIIKPGRGSREPKILLWVSVRRLQRCFGWRRAACLTPQADARIAGAVGCLVDVIPAGHGWLGDLHWGSRCDLKGENKFPLTLHPKEEPCTTRLCPAPLRAREQPCLQPPTLLLRMQERE